jgi:nucleoside-diphosphate-sugar epimerase
VLIGADSGYFAHCLTGASRAPEVLLDVQHYVDVRHVSAKLLEGVDAVVHLAAISNDPIGNLYEEVTLAVNHQASVDLAVKARSAGVRAFVFASSCSVYGSADDRPRRESSTLNPLTPYARSKVLTEQALQPMADADFAVTCLRFATACGMSDRLRLDLVLNDFVACALSSGRITVLSDGSPWRPLINVRDMARAFDWAIGRSVTEGGECLVVNVGSNEWNYQVHELAAAVAAAVPGTDVSINRDAPPDRRSYRVDFSLYEALAPLHQPLVTLPQAITELRDGLRAMRFDDADFRNSWMIRLRVLADLRARGLLDETLSWTDRSPALSGASTSTAAATR